MRQIIPFKKELPFKTKVSDITSISLERKIDILEGGIVTGTFYITGDYKMNEGSINREDFSFDLPFDITLDPRYDISTVKADIEDFYYDIINEDTLKVNIDLFIEAEYLPIEEDKSSDDMIVDNDSTLIEDSNDDREASDISLDMIDEDISLKEDNSFIEDINTINNVNTNININNNDNDNKLDIDSDDKSRDNEDFASDLFSNLDNTETYTTYYVYVVKEEDTIDKIMSLYGVSKEDIECYNDIGDIKPGDKIIIPKTSE